MERKIEYVQVHPPAGQKVRGFLKSKQYSTQSLKLLKQDPEAVRINGKPVFMNHILRDGDRITVWIRDPGNSDQIFPVRMSLEIVYEDEDLLVINKPAGMPVHPSFRNRDNTLGNGLAWYFRQRGEAFVYRCINRLDRDTSGLTVVAKHLVSAGILQGSIRREYLAIVKGEMEQEEGIIDAPIGRKEGSCLERQIDFLHGERAITHYRVLDRGNGHSLVLLRLETGRTHQIRVHMKYLGYPLIGDYLYFPDRKLISRQALHAFRSSFPQPMTGERLSFTAPVPADMREVMETLKLKVAILEEMCNTESNR